MLEAIEPKQKTVRRRVPKEFPISIHDPLLAPPILKLHRALDLASLWQAIIATMDTALVNHHIIAALPFEGVAPMALRTTLPMSDPQAFWLQLHHSKPPLNRVVAEQPGIKYADLDDLQNEAALKKSRFWRDIMQPYGWRHSAGLLFWENGEFKAHVGICRTEAHGPFSEADKQLLLALHPHLEAALLRVAAYEREKMLTTFLREALEHPVDGIALIDSYSKTVFYNQAAVRTCALWSHGRQAAARKVSIHRTTLSLPPELVSASASLLERYLADFQGHGTDGKSYIVEKHHPTEPGLYARLRIVAAKNSPVPPHVRLELSRNTSKESHSPMFRLSKAEYRVALLVAGGARNQDIATSLTLSVHTVRAHLREIFTKLGITHRGGLTRLFADHSIQSI